MSGLIWTDAPIRAAMLTGILAVLTAAALTGARFGGTGGGGRSFTVTVEYRGVGPTGIEEQIARPLESRMAALSGVSGVRTVSEPSRCRMTVSLAANADPQSFSMELRHAVQEVYRTLPPAVQRPRICGGAWDDRPVFVVAFAPSQRAQVEQQIKPALERVEGVGEVEVGGGDRAEIHVEVLGEKAARAGLSTMDVARLLKQQHLGAGVGLAADGAHRIPVIYDARFSGVRDLRDLLIGDVRLGELAWVKETTADRLVESRLDGERRTTVYVRASGSTNTVLLSRRLRRELELLRNDGPAGEIVVDLGHDIGRALREALISLLVGMCSIGMLLMLFLGDLRAGVLVSLLLPLAGCISIAVVSRAGIMIGENELAGLAVGVGLMADAAIVVSEAGRRRLRQTLGPITASSLTTLVALAPLLALGERMDGLYQRAAVMVACVLVASVLLSTIILPPLLRSGPRPRRRSRRTRITRRALRVWYRIVLCPLRRPLPFIAGAALAVGVSGVVLMGAHRADPGRGSNNLLYAHLEMPTGMSVSAVDERAAALAADLGQIPGITRVESRSRRGSADMAIRNDPKQLSAAGARLVVAETARRIPEVFLHLPVEDRGEQSILVSLLGTDHAALRSLAREAATRLELQEWVSRVVLHFKPAAPTLVFQVDIGRAAAAGLAARDIGAALRWGVHGPVAVKWMRQGTETDIRVRAPRTLVQDVEALSRYPVLTPAGTVVHLGELGDLVERREEERLYRQDSMGAVSLSVYVRNTGLLRGARSLEVELRALPRPEGYLIEIDRSVRELGERMTRLWVALALAACGVYIVLAAQSQSLRAPLAVLATLPVSLSVPVLALGIAGIPMTVSVVVGLIILSGVVVNAGILTLCPGRGTPRGSRVAVLRRRLRPVLLTSAATVLGVLPLVLRGGLLQEIGFVAMWAAVGSLLCSMLFTPALLSRTGAGGGTG